MTAARSLPSHDRHVHMSHVREHLKRAAHQAAIIHGRGVGPHHHSPVPPVPLDAAVMPPDSPPGGGGASSIPAGE